MRIKQCEWSQNGHQNMADYHQNEWGFAVFDEEKTFELMILEIMRAGLSWQTILNKRLGFQKAFSNYRIQKIAQYNDYDMEKLLKNPAIVRNKRKVEAIVSNAQLLAQKNATSEFSLNTYLWSFVDDKPLVMDYQTQEDMQGFSELSKKISRELKKQGFKFLGPTIVQSWLEALGIINSHVETCPIKQQCIDFFAKNYTL
ncbi:DNA-3-methyladenine glycosylase I [Holzapfeliella sp. He02]|uniref:DNA-3-methyladenine glycosylase I n=1 Tax=Holzapfeliella saturejae TaxID=3082953 RepID=A0ABU8SGD4_9LACO